MADQKVTRTDGAVVTIVSLKKDDSPYGGVRVEAVGVDAEGNDFSEYVTPTQAKNLLEVEDLLPQELRVDAFKSPKGPGFRFSAPNES